MKAASIVVRQMIDTKAFLEGAAHHKDGLAGYVRDFLEDNKNSANENGREWTVEACADALKIPDKTLRRWVEELEPDKKEEDTPADQDGHTARGKKTAKQKAKRKQGRINKMTPNDRQTEIELLFLSLDRNWRDKVMGRLVEIQLEGGETDGGSLED